MNHTYRPSGRISLLFVPVYAVMLFMAFISAFVCIFCIQFSPYTVLDFFICFAITKGIGKYGGFCSVRYGKNRNPFFASLCGIFAALWYGYLLVVLYLPIKEMFQTASFSIIKDAPQQIIKKCSFSGFINALNELQESGAKITGKSGNAFFVLPGSICIALLVILGMITIIYFVSVFWRTSTFPYFEDSGKWAKDIIFTCSPPGDEELYISKLLLGDTALLAQLEPLSEVNVDHYEITLFAGSGKEPYYASVSRMENSGEVERRTGKMLFHERELVKYLAVDRETGNALLMRKTNIGGEAAVRVVTDETERSARKRLLIDWAVSLLLIVFGAVAIFKIDKTDLPKFMMKGGFFYFAIMFLGNAVRFIRSFQKETIIESTEDRFEYDGTKRYLGKETTEPVIYKLFYLFLALSAAILFGICVWRM